MSLLFLFSDWIRFAHKPKTCYNIIRRRRRISGGGRMLTIKNGTITMNRADSVYITLTVRDSQGNSYKIQDGDTFYFAAKKKATDSDYAIAPKKLAISTDDEGITTAVLELVPEDTEQLAFGAYIYDIRMTTKRGTSSIIIKPSTLNIEETITGIGDM